MDDASTDNSLEIISKAKEIYQNLIVVKNKRNLGAVASYNLGLSYVMSPFVYFAAADDQTNPELFSCCLKYLVLDMRPAFACAEVSVFDSEPNEFSLRPIIRPRIQNRYMSPADIRKEFTSNENWIMTGACVFRTAVVRDIGGMPSNLSSFADSIMARKLAFRNGCVFIPYIGTNWKISAAGLSRGTFSDLNTFLTMKELVKSYIASDRDFPSWYWPKYSKSLEFSNIRLALNSLLPEWTILRRYFGSQTSTLYIQYRRIKTLRMFLLFIGYIRFHPFSLRRYISTYIQRKLEFAKAPFSI